MQPFGDLSVLVVPADRAAEHPDALDRLRRGELDAVLVQGLFDPQAAEDLRVRLEAELAGGTLPCLDIQSPAQRNRLIAVGHPAAPTPLHPSGPPPQWYVEQAAEAVAWAAGFFGPGMPWQQRLERVGSALQGGRAWVPHVDEQGRPWATVSVRGFRPGSGFLPHAESMYSAIPLFDPVREALEVEAMLGFFCPLAKVGGGGLTIWRGAWKEGIGNTFELPDDLDRHPHGTIWAGPGDLLIHLAGRNTHEVRPVEGDRIRWTVGGFAAWRRDGSGVEYWA